jgi:aerobic carbon-monoxide dehydrogenase small subunit
VKKQLKFILNGDPIDIWIDPKLLLVQVIRDELGLKGTHRACDEGCCCVCTVNIDGMAVKSCSVLAMQAYGRNVLTIEGMANGAELHPIQEAFVDNWAFQCGFCTSGQIMASNALLQENPNPTREEVQHAMDGHLCRCTGYNMINEAIRDAAGRLQAQKSEEKTK